MGPQSLPVSRAPPRPVDGHTEPGRPFTLGPETQTGGRGREGGTRCLFENAYQDWAEDDGLGFFLFPPLSPPPIKLPTYSVGK